MIFHGINFAKIFKLKYLLRIFRHIESIKKKRNRKKRLIFIFMQKELRIKIMHFLTPFNFYLNYK